MSSIIPNSTPTPNFYYDQLEHLLTPDEWKVLTYAVRRIFGFEKNRDSTYATISLSTFENGVTYQNKETGEVIRLSYGCGMSRPRISACLTAIVKFGIMRRGRNTKDGRVWRLETDETKIDFDGLWARFNAQQETAAQRVAKAAQASADKRRKQEPSTTGVLGEEVRQSYPQEYDSPTTTGKAVVPTESNLKATGKQDSPEEKTPPAALVEESTPQPPTLFTVVLKANYGIDYVPKMKLDKKLAKFVQSVVNVLAASCVQPPITPEELQRFVADTPAQFLPRDPAGWLSGVNRWRKEHPSASNGHSSAQPIRVITSNGAASGAEISAALEATRRQLCQPVSA